MGEVLHFPNGHGRDIKSAHSCDRVPIRIDVPQPSDVTPVEILQDLLRQAEADQLVFLALHAFRVDGTCVHIEIGLVDPQSEDPPEAS